MKVDHNHGTRNGQHTHRHEGGDVRHFDESNETYLGYWRAREDGNLEFIRPTGIVADPQPEAWEQQAAKNIVADSPNVKDPYPEDQNPKDLLGVKKAPIHLVPPALRIAAAPALANGAAKYGPYNWRTKAVKLSVYLAAAQRHIDAYWDGEELAEDSGIAHLSHAIACLAIIVDAASIGKLVDDRPTPGGSPALMKEQDQSAGTTVERVTVNDALAETEQTEVKEVGLG